MKRTKKTLGTVGIPASLPSVGHGYVVIPSDVSRDEYLKNCYKNNTINLRSEDGNLYRNVLVDSDVIQKIQFPSDDKSIGSLLIWVNIPKHNQLVAVALVDVKSSINKIINEFQTKIQKVATDGHFVIEGDASEKILGIHVNSEIDDKGEINVSVINPNNTAKFNLFVKGVINLFSTEELTLRTNKLLQLIVEDEEENNLFKFSYDKGEGLTVIDEFEHKITTDKDKITIQHKDGKKIELNKDDVVFNGGSNGGLIKISDLVNEINTFKQSFNTHTHNLVATAGPYPVSGSAIPISAQVSQTQKNSIENKDVKH